MGQQHDKIESSFFLSIIHSTAFKHFLNIFELIFGSRINAYSGIAGTFCWKVTFYLLVLIFVRSAYKLQILEKMETKILNLWKRNKTYNDNF